MSETRSGTQRVTFSLRAPDAQRVAVAGSFNDWQSDKDYLADPGGTGTFQLVKDIPGGEHEYKYVVDGRWTLNPNKPWRATSDGAANHFIPEPTNASPGRQLSPLAADTYLGPFLPTIKQRRLHREATEQRLTEDGASLESFACAHEYYGRHADPKDSKQWILREWAPNATAITVVGDFCGWRADDGIPFNRINPKGDWEAHIPKSALDHGDLYRLHLSWNGGEGERLPAYARRLVQNEETKGFDAQIWSPKTLYTWEHQRPTSPPRPLLIYEAHVGLAQEEAKVGSYNEFREHILPRIADAGYNAIQLMALMEHPYYGSFGYHVANFFACSSRFGTPEELKALVDTAHGLGLRVIMDLVHSHATKNEMEGLSRFDGTLYQYFHDGPRGDHVAWDSRCFNYEKPEVLHFLLSNCRYWLDEFQIDGFRFDGVTSMLYAHHGLGVSFDNYGVYFDDQSVDQEAYTYLALANQLIHRIHPQAITIAEDVSGMPGLGSPIDEGGCGFDARMAMGIPDHWFRLTDLPDEDWNVEQLWYELTNRRQDERTISYVESHDQALVGGQGFLFQMIGAAIYDGMVEGASNAAVDRGIALHKMARLFTLATSDAGYLNFIGNEFGHPEWIDFPREGNHWSYHYARRQWSLRDNPELRFHGLANFDRALVNLIRDSNCLHQPTELLMTHQGDQVIAFQRGALVFILNFHPTQSHTDYAIPVPPGSLDLALHSDAVEFSGHGRLEAGQEFVPEDGRILTYLPTRTALVLRLS